MNTTFIITNLAPAMMLFFIAIVVRFFPPSKGTNPFVLKVPEWWARDEKTWYSAYGFLAKRYLQYSLLLAIICIVFLWYMPVYGATFGYLFLVGFFSTAQWQARQFMNKNIK